MEWELVNPAGLESGRSQMAFEREVGVTQRFWVGPVNRSVWAVIERTVRTTGHVIANQLGGNPVRKLCTPHSSA